MLRVRWLFKIVSELGCKKNLFYSVIKLTKKDDFVVIISKVWTINRYLHSVFELNKCSKVGYLQLILNKND